MHNPDSSMLTLYELKQAIRPTALRDELLANVLGRAFHDEPNVVYVLPDEPARRALLPSFFLKAIGIARLYGHVDTAPTIAGAALWFCPGRDFTLAQMVQTQTVAPSINLRKTLKRYLKLTGGIEEVHHRLIREPHWYLVALSLQPTEQARSMGNALIKPGLARADSYGLSCYLETFQERDLPFYEERGFRIAGAGCIPGGPNFWAMIRTPSQSDVFHDRREFANSFANSRDCHEPRFALRQFDRQLPAFWREKFGMQLADAGDNSEITRNRKENHA